MADPQTPQDQAQPKPIFDMSKAVPLDTPVTANKPLFDMSKAVPLNQPASATSTAGTVARRGPGGEMTIDPSILKEAGQGVLGNVLEFTSGVGSLINKITPDTLKAKLGEPVPEQGLKAESQISEELQQTPSQKLGSTAADVGLLATGEGVLEETMGVIGRMAAKYPHVMEVMEKMPKASGTIRKFLSETAKSGAKSGTVMGAEQGVRESKPGGEGFVEGAKEGAIGGIVGGAAGEVAGAVAKPIGKAMGITTAAEEDAMRALKPGKREYKFLQNWSTAKDRLVKEIGEDGKFENWPDAVDRIHNVADKVWSDEVQPLIRKHVGEDLFPSAALPVPKGTTPAYNPVAEAIRSNMDTSPNVAQHFKKYNTTLESIAKSYEHPMTVGEGERIVEKLNADLGKKGYWKLSPSEQKQWETADASVAGAASAARALRKSLDDRLDTLVGGDSNFQRLKHEYGALRGIENDARGQLNVQGRQAPISMKKLIGITAGVAHGGPAGVVTALLPFADEFINNPTSLLNRAVSKSTPDSALAMTAKGAAEVGAKTAQKSLPVLGTIMFRASDGSVHKVNEDQWGEVQKLDPGAEQVHAGGGKK